jgi:excisionase family DNA binding protein
MTKKQKAQATDKPEALRGLLTVPQAAHYLSVSERFIWGISRPGGPLRTVRLGGAVRFDLKDLEDYVSRCKGSQ